MTVVSLTPLDWLLSFSGGILIGLAAGIMMLAAGQVAGISGIFQKALSGRGEAVVFLLGLPLGAGAVSGIMGMATPEAFAAPWRLVLAGLLVGAGSYLANGCTSGHAVCGLARFSKRSLVATIVFISTGMAVVAVVGGVS
ncbi:conserved membrane hypothetical protein [Candidatus Terasakiella magnetica]|nr:conserved membrane hypothetical protein [Candidatus Terasakiella magnetica]